MRSVIFSKNNNGEKSYGITYWGKDIDCCPKCNSMLEYRNETCRLLRLQCPKCKNETYGSCYNVDGKECHIIWGTQSEITKEAERLKVKEKEAEEIKIKEEKRKKAKERKLYAMILTPVILIGIIYLLFSFDAIDCNGSYNRNGSYNNNSYNRCKYTYSGGKKCTSRATRAGLCDYHYGIMEDDLDDIYDAYGD